MGVDSYLYSYGYARLPVSTASLIIASQLCFMAFFANLFMKQKYTSYSINVVVLLTIGSGVLALHMSSDRPDGESMEYLMGFVMTLAAVLLVGLLFPLTELTYYKTKQTITFTLVLEIHVVICLFAAIFCTIGMIVNNDFKVISKEATYFELGKTKYYTILCHRFNLAMQLLWNRRSNFLCIFVAIRDHRCCFTYNNRRVLGVVFYKEKFQVEKGVALVFSLLGLTSYFYEEYKFTKKSKDLAQTNNLYV